MAFVDGVRLHLVEAGAGPPVVLLHGFPEFWYSWSYLIPALADAGFLAVAPDMRGLRGVLPAPPAPRAGASRGRPGRRRPGTAPLSAPPDPAERCPIEAPTLLIWGDRDPYLVSSLTHRLERWVPDLRVARIPDASHRVQVDAAERVNRLLVEFLRA